MIADLLLCEALSVSLPRSSAWQNRTALTRMKIWGTNQYTNAPLKSASTASLRLRNPGFTRIALPLGLLLYMVLPTCWQDASAVAYGLCPQSPGSWATWHQFFPGSVSYLGRLAIKQHLSISPRSTTKFPHYYLARSYSKIGQKHLDPRDGYTPPCSQ